jgi:hypothetical protein
MENGRSCRPFASLQESLYWLDKAGQYGPLMIGRIAIESSNNIDDLQGSSASIWYRSCLKSASEPVISQIAATNTDFTPWIHIGQYCAFLPPVLGKNRIKF